VTARKGLRGQLTGTTKRKYKVNDNDAEDTPFITARDLAFSNWSEDPAIRRLINLATERPDPDSVETLVLSAFEAAWSGGYRYAND
jgi:hypothetical protein